MIFNSKQLEELEQSHDSSGALEDQDEDAPDNSRDASMEWRLQLIEEAAENVKRAKTRPVDESFTYEIASLLFDRETRRFARVQASIPGYLRIGYLTGGDREYGTLDVDLYLIDMGESRKPADLALQLGVSEEEVLTHLARLDITPLDPDGEDEEEPPAAEAPAKGLAGIAAAEPPRATPAKKSTNGASKAAKPAKAKAKPKSEPKPKAGGKKKGEGDPLSDPNAFIREKYKAMSNREMARATGLSEHTIRRKLGEWGLKRKAAGKKKR